jgi:hypothetical protein
MDVSPEAYGSQSPPARSSARLYGKERYTSYIARGLLNLLIRGDDKINLFTKDFNDLPMIS